MRKQHSAPAGRLQQSRPEFESTFQELYKSLFSSQENVALKEKYCARLIARKDLSNYRALQNLTQRSKTHHQAIYKVEHSIQNKQLTLKDSSSDVRVVGTCSATTETAKLSAKTPNVKCDIFLYKAESNTKTGFSPKRQQTRQIQGSSPTTIGDEALHDDDSMSIHSGEDYRETVTCETCSETFWKVVNKKEIRKRKRDKKQPYDPTSLSCDRWVLKKPLLPRDNLHKYRSYKSLFSSQENVALKEKYCARLIARKDLSNYRALQNLTQRSKTHHQAIYKVEHSIQNKQLTLKDSSSDVRVVGTCSATTETAKLSAKTPNVKCDIFLYKAESNTKTGFSPKRQQTRQIQGSSPTTIGDEALHDDDSMSIHSGEDYRETVTCETCSETFWKVVNKKEIRKRKRDKKQPYDPTSLSCDRWVLKKPLLPRDNLHKYRREIEPPVTYLKSLEWSAQTRDAKKWIPQCSRSHMFLHRNLRSCKRKVDEFLHENGKRGPLIKVRKRSRKKNLFVYKLPEAHPSASVLSPNEDSEFEMENCSVKRKLASAVLNREARSKKDGCDFSDDSNTCESGFCSYDSRSMQCDNSTCPRKDKFALDVFGSDTTTAFSTSALLCTENRLYSQLEDRKLWQETPDKNSTDPLSSSFGWLKPGGFTSMIAKLKARHQTLPGSVVKET